MSKQREIVIALLERERTVRIGRAVAPQGETRILHVLILVTSYTDICKSCANLWL